MSANKSQGKRTSPSTTKGKGDALDGLSEQPKKLGRPPKKEEEKYKSTHIRLHPKVVAWAKAEAKKRGVGYQSVINEALLEIVAS